MIRDTLRWVIVAAVSLVATTACVADKGSAAPGLADSTTGPSASVSSGLPVQSAEGITRFDDPGLAGFLLADPAHHRLWSGTSSGLWWIDPETEVAHVVDDIPGVYLAVYHDSLFRAAWAHDNVARYDLRDDVREDVRRDAPSPLNIAAGPAGVWVSDHNHGNLLRLDPQTMRVTAKVKIGDGKGLGPAGLQWQGEDLWVNVKRDSTLALVDGGNGHVLRRIPLDGVDIGDELAMTIAGLWGNGVPLRFLNHVGVDRHPDVAGQGAPRDGRPILSDTHRGRRTDGSRSRTSCCTWTKRMAGSPIVCLIFGYQASILASTQSASARPGYRASTLPSWSESRSPTCADVSQTQRPPLMSLPMFVQSADSELA